MLMVPVVLAFRPTHRTSKTGAFSGSLPSALPAFSCPESALFHRPQPCRWARGAPSQLFHLLVHYCFLALCYFMTTVSVKVKPASCLTKLCEFQTCFSINSREIFLSQEEFCEDIPVPFATYSSARWQCQGVLFFFYLQHTPCQHGII